MVKRCLACITICRQRGAAGYHEVFVACVSGGDVAGEEVRGPLVAIGGEIGSEGRLEPGRVVEERKEVGEVGARGKR